METDSNLHMMLSQAGIKLKAKVLEKRINSEHKVLYFPAHNRFYSSFNKKFKQMFEAGLFDHFTREVKEIYSRGARHQVEAPFKVLTL